MVKIEKNEMLKPTLANLFGLEIRFKAMDEMKKNTNRGKFNNPNNDVVLTESVERK